MNIIEYCLSKVENKDIYRSEYYRDNGIIQADAEYLKRCIEAYGLNADEELGRIKHGFC